MIQIKRAYEKPAAADGYRVLVDRLWPRGVTKEAAALDEWAKEVAPSDGLRKELHGHSDRWREFRERYWEELDGKGDLVEGLRQRAAGGTLTLVYAARDVERNNAVALREYLERG
ncbi:MAG TPA: DUF488 family protein [Thermoanaerobaculia bacterium]|nr:DUF488 family protein [Thermoanaerobaculia bacterium]